MWSSYLPLEGLVTVRPAPNICRGSLRIFGNAGLFSYTGLYWNKKLGRYRLIATDLKKATVLVFPHRTVVITPAIPQVFIDYFNQKVMG